ncbi:DUF2750 domain-containing protein [Microlunatus flavus]|uniref:DUF2750 domain-containing protein n=1 Tax=Microlunatus flavus TaxID=1036181 RepID=A0A1H9J0N2_9ACTN|nr:DUF2750 domain-containing protein [Microlunatus flavus]SEQ80410.1 Protein of unknown function [Microlunatus flavus]
MTVSAAQADAFYREVVEGRTVWTIRDDAGIPAPLDPFSELRAMPFWSREPRARRVVDTVAAYAGFRVDLPITLDVWCERWLPGLERDGLLVGVSWSGARATGYDTTPADMLRNLTARMPDPAGGGSTSA